MDKRKDGTILMANPLFNLLGGNSNMFPPQFQNFQNMMQKLNEFQRGFQGDPKQQVQDLLNSGKMTQNQYNQLSQMAMWVQKMMNQ